MGGIGDPNVDEMFYRFGYIFPLLEDFDEDQRDCAVKKLNNLRTYIDNHVFFYQSLKFDSEYNGDISFIRLFNYIDGTSSLPRDDSENIEKYIIFKKIGDELILNDDATVEQYNRICNCKLTIFLGGGEKRVVTVKKRETGEVKEEK